MAVKHRDMTTIQKAQPSRGRGAAFSLYLLFVGLLLFTVTTLFMTLGRAPARQLRAQLPGVGTIQVTLRLVPDPPKVGSIPFAVTATGRDGQILLFDTISASYGSTNQADRSASLKQTGPTTYEGVVEFPTVGDWWLSVIVGRDGKTAEVRFPIKVVPNL